MFRLLLAVVLVFCGLSEASAQRAAPGHGLGLDAAFVLGEAAGNADLMFGDPVAVGADEAGRLYVVDQLSLRIKVFDRRGRFVRALGGRGRAEGQMVSVAGVHVAPDGTVLAVDQLASRFTWFAPGGEARTAPLDPEVVSWPRSIVSAPGGYFLLYRRPGADAMLHAFGADLGQPRQSVLPFATVLGSDDRFLDDLSFLSPGTLARWGERVAVAPAVCSGQLAVIDAAAPARAPHVLRGSVPDRIMEPASVDAAADGVTVVSGPNGRRAARLFCRSAGLVALPDGRLVHFSVRRLAGSRVLFAEVFDGEGRLAGAGVVREVPLPAAPSPYLSVQVFGGPDGRLAVVDRTGDVPVVRVFDTSS